MIGYGCERRVFVKEGGEGCLELLSGGGVEGGEIVWVFLMWIGGGGVLEERVFGFVKGRDACRAVVVVVDGLVHSDGGVAGGGAGYAVNNVGEEGGHGEEGGRGGRRWRGLGRLGGGGGHGVVIIV